MAYESSQDRIENPGKVNLHLQVDKDGAEEIKELPLVIGVQADLSGDGDPEKPIPDYENREFNEIHRENFNSIMAGASPTVNLDKIELKIGPDAGKKVFNASLNFKSMEDFNPENVAEQVEPLKDLLELRRILSRVRNLVTSNSRVEKALMNQLSDQNILAMIFKNQEIKS